MPAPQSNVDLSPLAIIALAFVWWTPRHFPPIGVADAAPPPPPA
jgi:hypothetical protein